MAATKTTPLQKECFKRQVPVSIIKKNVPTAIKKQVVLTKDLLLCPSASFPPASKGNDTDTHTHTNMYQRPQTPYIGRRLGEERGGYPLPSDIIKGDSNGSLVNVRKRLHLDIYIGFKQGDCLVTSEAIKNKKWER
jgi:hypothetical protein